MKGGSTELGQASATPRSPVERGRRALEGMTRASSARAIVLAGVHEWGGCALGAATPRPLVPVANHPLIEYAVRWLADSGVCEICVCANSDTTFLRRYLTGLPDAPAGLEFYEDTMPRGPAGCARDAWCDSECQAVLVVDGTIIPQVQAASLLEEHGLGGADMTIAVSRRGDHASPERDMLAPVGVYAMSLAALACIPEAGYCDIKELLIPRLIHKGHKVVTHLCDAPSPRVTGTQSYKAINDWMVEKAVRTERTPDGYLRMGDALVHESASVAPNCRMVGPVLVGPGTCVGEGSSLVGPVSLGRCCRINDGAVVSRSSVWEGCVIGERAGVDRCVVTHHGRVKPSSRAYNSVIHDGRTRMLGYA